MALALLKLLLTPLLIGGASLGARRWGPTVGGWIVSLPLTSGPVALFLAVGQGASFGASAAHASLGGCLAIAAYAVGYARLAAWGWPVALAGGATGWLAGALVAWAAAGWPAVLLFAVVVAASAVSLRLLPDHDASAAPGAASSPSDIGVRMAAGTAIVVLVTAIAPIVGPEVSGVLAMLPIIASILAMFAHRAGGASDGIRIQRGVLSGLVGTATFLAVVAGTLVPWGVLPSFGAALAAVVAVQVLILRALPRDGTSPVRTAVEAGPVGGALREG